MEQGDCPTSIAAFPPSSQGNDGKRRTQNDYKTNQQPPKPSHEHVPIISVKSLTPLIPLFEPFRGRIFLTVSRSQEKSRDEGPDSVFTSTTNRLPFAGNLLKFRQQFDHEKGRIRGGKSAIFRFRCDCHENPA
jgi:hypothetical protein